MKNSIFSKSTATISLSLLFFEPNLWAGSIFPAVVPAMKFFKMGKVLSPTDQTLNWLFIGVIFAGGVLLILTSFSDIVLSAPGYRSLFGMYLACWAAYGIWYLDVRFGLPKGMSRFQVLPIFLSVTAGLLFLREIFDYLGNRFRPLEKGMIRCGFCREVISKLMIECPYCHKKV